MKGDGKVTQYQANQYKRGEIEKKIERLERDIKDQIKRTEEYVKEQRTEIAKLRCDMRSIGSTDADEESEVSDPAAQ